MPQSGSSAEGERSRAGAAGSATTIREKYAECMVKPTTTAFAVHANGQLMVLDDTSNTRVREQMGSGPLRGALMDESGTAKWATVTIDGSMSGDKLSVNSINK